MDYNQNIEFVLGKAQEIQQDLLANTAPALKDYLAGLNQQLTQDMRMAITDSFQVFTPQIRYLTQAGTTLPSGIVPPCLSSLILSFH